MTLELLSQVLLFKKIFFLHTLDYLQKFGKNQKKV